MSVNPKYLKCLQINLRHSRRASASLAQVILENDFDFVFIQEPYAICIHASVLTNVPPGYDAFHNLSNDHAFGAAIIVKSCYSAVSRPVPVQLSNFVSFIDVTTCVGTFRLLSIYVRPSIRGISSTLRPILDCYLTPTTIIAIGSNAKNRLWNSSTTDNKGMELTYARSGFDRCQGQTGGIYHEAPSRIPLAHSTSQGYTNPAFNVFK